MARCVGKKDDGTACKRIVKDTQSFCSAHDPKRADERKRNAIRGGKAGGRSRISPATFELTRLQQLFEQMAQDVESGTLDKGKAAVMVQAINGARACVQAAVKAREVEELEGRIAALEALEAQRSSADQRRRA